MSERPFKLHLEPKPSPVKAPTMLDQDDAIYAMRGQTVVHAEATLLGIKIKFSDGCEYTFEDLGGAHHSTFVGN